MFTLALRAEFTHTVTVLTPVDGGHREDTLRARFVAISAEEEADLLEVRDDGVSLLRRIVVGLEDIVDTSGRPVEFTPELLSTLLGLQWVRYGLVSAYRAAVTKFKKGN